MNLQQIARKLRAAADVLDELLGIEKADRSTVNETSDTAHRIRQTLRKKSRAYAPGTHWTQRPENRARVARLAKKGAAKRNAKRTVSPLKGKKYRGTHWTQTPAGKRKMAIVQRKAWRKRHTAQVPSADLAAVS